MNILFFIVIFISFPTVHVHCRQIRARSDSDVPTSWDGTTEDWFTTEAEASPPPSFRTTTDDWWFTTDASPTPTSVHTITIPDDNWPTGSYDYDGGPRLGNIALFFGLIALGIVFLCLICGGCCYFFCLRSSKLGFGNVNNIMTQSQAVNADAESDNRGIETIPPQLDNQHSRHTVETENYAYHQQDAYYDDAPPPPYSSLAFDNNFNNGVPVSPTAPPISSAHSDNSVIELDKDSFNVT